MIFTERITIIRPRTIPGEYGGTEESWDDPEIIEIDTPVSVQPRGSSEEHTAMSQFVSEVYRLYSEPPTLLLELGENDRVRVEPWGVEMEVKGVPSHWRGELLPHTEADLEVLRGARRN